MREERVAGAARADLDQGARLGGLGRVPDRLEEARDAVGGVFRRRVGVGRVVAGRRAVQVLAVDLEAVEAPLAERLPREGGRVVAHRADGPGTGSSHPTR